jgi:CRP-like cAMP-binding protein
MISVFLPAEDARDLELIQIGAEGFVGLPALFGARLPYMTAVVRAPGYAVCLTTRLFQEAIADSRPFAKLLNAYAYAFICATAIAATCCMAHLLEQRCARWLLAAQDHLDTDSFALTHEELARVLGVRRASVIAAVTKLQRNGVIGFKRGLLTISDRRRLERTSCSCYQRIRSVYGILPANAK